MEKKFNIENNRKNNKKDERQGETIWL